MTKAHTKRVQFQGPTTADSLTFTPGDYQATSFTLNGQVYELKDGVEVRTPSLDFTVINDVDWELPFFAFQTGNGKIGFKDGVLSAGTTMTNTYWMAGHCTSATTTVAYGVSSGVSNYADLGLVSYTPPSAPTINSAVALGVSSTTFSCCTDGTDFYGAGLNSGGNIKIVKATPSGTVSWTQTNPGPWSLGAAIASPGNVNNQQQGSACIASGGVLYVYFPQWGIAKYSTTDGTLLGTGIVITSGSISAGAGGYQAATANVGAQPPMMTMAGSIIAVPIQTGTVGYLLGSNCRHGLAFVNVTTGLLAGVTVFALGPARTPLTLDTDGTDFYVLVPENDSTDVANATIKKYHADGAFVWSSSPFATGAALTAFQREVMIYISGSTQVLAGNKYETVLVDPSTGQRQRTTSALDSSPQWMVDVGSA